MRLKLLFVVVATFFAMFLAYWVKSHRPTGSAVAIVTRSGQSAGPVITRTFQARPSAAAAANVSTGQKSLLPPVSTTWERAADRPEFSRFVEWTHRYQSAATAQEKS